MKKLFTFTLFLFASFSIAMDERKLAIEQFSKFVQDGEINEVKKMLQNPPAGLGGEIVYWNNENGDHPILIAVKEKNIDITKVLLAADANPSEGDDYNDKNALSLAIKAKNYQILQILINNTLLDIDIDQQLEGGNTVLMLAIKSQNIKIIKAVADLVPDTSIKNNNNKTADDFVNDIIDTTLKNQIISLLKKIKDQSDFHKAIQDENKYVIIELVTKKLINFNISTYSKNPLINAIEKENFDMVKFFVENDANANQLLQWDRIPIFAAAKSSQDILEFILSKNVKVNQKDVFGDTPLFYATEKLSYDNKLPTVTLLIKAEANINAQNKDGTTILMIGANKPNKNFVQQVLGLGADPLIRDNENRTALDIAKQAMVYSPIQEKNKEEIIKILEKKSPSLTESLNQLTKKLNVLSNAL